MANLCVRLLTPNGLQGQTSPCLDSSHADCLLGSGLFVSWMLADKLTGSSVWNGQNVIMIQIFSYLDNNISKYGVVVCIFYEKMPIQNNHMPHDSLFL